MPASLYVSSIKLLELLCWSSLYWKFFHKVVLGILRALGEFPPNERFLILADPNTMLIIFKLMAPRENYFFYILTQVKQAFDNYAPPDKLESYDDMWFECNGKPLKWNLPIGVQFDSLVGLSGKQEQLPWTLTFHYKESPLPK